VIVTLPKAISCSREFAVEPGLELVGDEHLPGCKRRRWNVLEIDGVDHALHAHRRLQEIAFGNVTITVPTNRCFYQTRVALPAPHAPTWSPTSPPGWMSSMPCLLDHQCD